MRYTHSSLVGADISLGYISGGFLYSQAEQTGMSSEAKTIEVDGETYEYTAEKPYQDAELLQTLYWEKGMSQRNIADSVSCGKQTVSRWMDRLDVESYKPPAERPPNFRVKDGYECWQTLVGEITRQVQVHRLLAVAEYGFDAVCEIDVHHKNSIKWDNRPENIEPKDRSQHVRDHADEQYGHEEASWRDEDRLHELCVERGLSQREAADILGCSPPTVGNWLDRFGIHVE